MSRSCVAFLILNALFSAPAAASAENPTFTRFVEIHWPDDEQYNTFSIYGAELGGAACLAYVDANSSNHKLLRNMMGPDGTFRYDSPLYNMYLRIGVAVDWQPKVKESITLFYRNPFIRLFKLDNLPEFQPENHTFPAKLGEPWKEKQLRSWFMKHAYPLVNMRRLDNKGEAFPGRKYIKDNTAGLVLVAMNMTGEREFSEQYKLLRWLKPHAEKYQGRLRFTLMERAEITRDLQAKLGVGQDPRVQSDMILVESLQPPVDKNDKDHQHGLKKYRLQNPTRESIDEFFEKYAKRQLIPYWKSMENKTYTTGEAPKGHTTRLTGLNFESIVYDEDPQKARLVAFFNMDPKDKTCTNCLRDYGIWELIAKRVAMREGLRAKVLIAAIDQSSNEHPEVKVSKKMGRRVLVWYPQGSRSTRFKRRRSMDHWGHLWKEDDLIKVIEDEVENIDEEEEKIKKRRRRKKKSEL